MVNQQLTFKGTWRAYQKRVLDKAEAYLNDGKVHIVAAPGSGKTTLGLELLGRLNQPALVLVPTITIREQWVNRLADAFLPATLELTTLVSQDLRQPKSITVVTYQALHSAMTGYKGNLVEEADADEIIDSQVQEAVDYSNFELIKTMTDLGLSVICLDECHHLRNEWWKTLEQFCTSFPQAKRIALTATPPYDSTAALWQRYTELCGEIDEEIAVPELVKEGSLCPHQDFVHFSLPTAAEEEQVRAFLSTSQLTYRELLSDKGFEQAILSHKILSGQLSYDRLLEHPEHLSAFLIYMQAKGLSYPQDLQDLLLTKRLPALNRRWLTILLQYFCYDDADFYDDAFNYRQSLIALLKGRGLVDQKQVSLTQSNQLNTLLRQSAGKLNSICEISMHEYANLGDNLRLLILTDYIRKEYISQIGQESNSVMRLGVLPIFDVLRQATKAEGKSLKIGVLCGSLVLIPTEAKGALLRSLGSHQVTLTPFAGLSDYLEVKPMGDGHFLTAAVTSLFEQGDIQALVGTKSLLGEGWDAPCVNALILASFVGSFMLSNQMRGRAIRAWKGHPEKSSNIWHLVAINPEQAVEIDWDSQPETMVLSEFDEERPDSGIYSPDYQQLERKMDHYLGLAYEGEVIESGLSRLSAIRPPFTKANIVKLNKASLDLSDKRNDLFKGWTQALTVHETFEVNHLLDVPNQRISLTLLFDAKRYALYALGWYVLLAALHLFIDLGWIGWLLIALSGVFCAVILYRYYHYRSPLRRLKDFGQALLKALLDGGLLMTTDCRVEVESLAADDLMQAIYLKGGTSRDKELFKQTVEEFFGLVDNQRYLLHHGDKKAELASYFAVPSLFDKKKTDAEAFAASVAPFLGDYELIYTRNVQGRKHLLKARIEALANQEARCLHRQVVKSSLR